MRRNLQALQTRRQDSAHPGLILSKYTGSLDKLNVLTSISELMGPMSPLYKQAFERYKSALQKHIHKKDKGKEFTSKGRLIVGLGNVSVLETGITLHHTFGHPYLPGTSLKGLAAAYCAAVWGEQNEAYRSGGKYYKIMFGDQDEAGFLTFYDAWIVPSKLEGSLQLDIMTVHHPDYYIQSQATIIPPSDMDDPVPVAFISVVGTFFILLECEDQSDEGINWENIGMVLLEEALLEWGIGSKTNSGYGRMKRAR